MKNKTMKCKHCGTKMRLHNVVKYKDGGGFEEVGDHAYCPKMSCSYEVDL